MSTHTHCCRKCFKDFKCSFKPYSGAKCNMPFCRECYKLWQSVKNDKKLNREFWVNAYPKFYMFRDDNESEDEAQNDKKLWCDCGEHWVDKDEHWSTNGYELCGDCMNCSSEKDLRGG